MEYQVNLLPLSASYRQAQEAQQAAHQSLLDGRSDAGHNVCGTLFLGEHEAVYTLGKHGDAGNVLVDNAQLSLLGIAVLRTNRGGDVTYHGPGQLVGYPVMDLLRLGLGAKEYVSRLLQCIAATLREFSIEAHEDEQAPGLWLPAQGGRPLRKICAIGIHISQGISTHGFALNVNTALEAFQRINPCGFTDRGVTSIAQELGHEVQMDDVKAHFAAAFESGFGIRLRRMEGAGA